MRFADVPLGGRFFAFGIEWVKSEQATAHWADPKARSSFQTGDTVYASPDEDPVKEPQVFTFCGWDYHTAEAYDAACSAYFDRTGISI